MMIDIQQIIDDAVVAEAKSSTGKRDTNYFHVSDAGLCYRARYLKRLGVIPTAEPTAKEYRKMRAGHAGHNDLQKVLRYNGQLFAAEGEIRTDHIVGHFDDIVKEGDRKTLVEFKTIEKFQMPYIVQDGPKTNHLIQMFTYWVYLRLDYTNLDQAVLAYVKREDFEAKMFNYAWSDDIRAQVAADWTPLLDYWLRQELPPCTCDKDYGGKGLKYCRYRSADSKVCCQESLMEVLV